MNKEEYHIIIDSIPENAATWIDTVSAFSLPLIAVAGVVIALQQYQVNSQRLKHELYDRRLVIFKHMKTYLSEILSTGKVSVDKSLEFNYNVSESIFLLDKNINKRIEEIYTKSIEMASYQEELYPADGSLGLPKGDQRTEVSHKKSELLKWLTHQLVELKPLFSKDLNLK